MSTDPEEPAHELPENPDLAVQLKLAIDADELEEVKRLMTRHLELHRASLGASKTPPLTWAAFGGGPPSETRLAMAQWMIENGSDIHQGDDGPLIRAIADPTFRMAELLVAHGADVNALYGGRASRATRRSSTPSSTWLRAWAWMTTRRRGSSSTMAPIPMPGRPSRRRPSSTTRPPPTRFTTLRPSAMPADIPTDAV
jgi:hypothetical protein